MYQLVLSGDTLPALHAELVKALGEVSTHLISEIRSEPEPAPVSDAPLGATQDPEPAPAPAPAPAPLEPVPTGLAITLEDLRDVLKTLKEKKGSHAVREVLNHFNADVVPDIPEDKRGDAIFLAQELYNAD